MSDGAPSGIIFPVRVTPRAAREQIGPLKDGVLSIKVTVPPVEGEANKAVVLCLSRALGIPKTDIQIVRGSRGRLKSVRVPAYAELAVKRLFVIHR
jgi:uncharacterized protein (TIGR00251 family)